MTFYVLFLGRIISFWISKDFWISKMLSLHEIYIMLVSFIYSLQNHMASNYFWRGIEIYFIHRKTSCMKKTITLHDFSNPFPTYSVMGRPHYVHIKFKLLKKDSGVSKQAIYVTIHKPLIYAFQVDTRVLYIHPIKYGLN